VKKPADPPKPKPEAPKEAPKPAEPEAPKETPAPTAETPAPAVPVEVVAEDPPPAGKAKSNKLFILGPPSSGKGALISKLVNTYKLAHLKETW